jgi:SAM-dependent methyltransferase
MTAPPTPPSQYLAAGFRNVDTSGNTAAYATCLDLLSGIPFFREVKEDTFRIIAATGPTRVLDAGCGAGTDLCALAGILPASCQLTGLDASAALLATAASRTVAHRNRCDLVRGDLSAIPCRDGAFSACRIDRVLQHIPDPAMVIRELARVTAPGGTIVAFDNDWETFFLPLDDDTVSARITEFWRDSFASGRVGTDLAAHFRNAGLEDIRVESRTLVLTDLPVAEKVFDITVLLERLRQEGIFGIRETEAIRDDLARRAAKGTFRSGYTGFIVHGTKPA